MVNHRKPNSVHAMAGSWRGDRHGTRHDRPRLEGMPEPPDDMSSAAKEHWDEIVPQLIEANVVRQIDQHALSHLCETHSLLKATAMRLREDPIDRDARLSFSQYFDRWARLAAQFGLTPQSRNHIAAEVPREEDKRQQLLDRKYC